MLQFCPARAVSCLLLLLIVAPVPAWTARFPNPAGDACPAAVAVDSERNVTVAGTAAGNGGSDFVVLKYDSTGALLWARAWDGPASGADSARAVCADAAGRVFVTGTAEHPGGRVMATLCWSESGTLLWAGLHDTLAAGDDFGAAVVSDGAGGCLVAGTGDAGSGHGQDISVIHWDSAGVRRWSQLYNGPGRGTDFATCAAGDDSGGIFVAGASAGHGDTLDYTLLHYAGNGTLAWFDRQRADSTAVPRALYRDPAHGMAVTGSAFFGPAAGWDAYTICYRPDLTRRWAQRFNGTGSTDDHGLSLDFGPDTSLYLAAVSCGTGTFLNAVGIRPNGTRLGVLTEPLSPDSVLLPAGIAVLPFIGFAVSASRQDTTGDWDYLLDGCDSLFEVSWESGYSGPFGDDLLRVQARVGTDALCLSGTSLGESGNQDILTVVHSLSGPGIGEAAAAPAPPGRLHAASPARGVLRFWFAGSPRPAELRLCGADGRTVRRMAIPPLVKQARLPLAGLPAGVYLACLGPGPAAPARVVVLR